MGWIYNYPRFYDFIDDLVSLGRSNKARKHALKDVKGKVLEVGVGTGKTSRFLKSKLHGVDVSKKMLKIAKKRGVKVFHADSHKLPFKKNSFDWVLFFFSLPCKNPKKAIKEALRVGKNVLILEYKPLNKKAEWFGKKVFNSPNWKLKKLLKGFKFSHKRFLNLYDIYKIKK
jgi:demethylmenaquinone methyltransferase/2-methoxy-6-polyprenyl-1,4-benzoquinol methylase